MYALLQELWDEWKCLFVIVTHDIHEAILLSHRIIVSGILPFQIKDTIDIPFEFPRNDSIISSFDYLSLASRLRVLF